MQFHRADITWGNLYIIAERDPFMDFTNWYSIEETCVMVPKPEPYPNILAATRPFSFLTWVTIGKYMEIIESTKVMH